MSKVITCDRCGRKANANIAKLSFYSVYLQRGFNEFFGDLCPNCAKAFRKDFMKNKTETQSEDGEEYENED